MGFRTSGQVLLLALLLACGVPLFQSAGGQVGGPPTAAGESSHPEPLAASSTSMSYLQRIGNLSGVWQDGNGNTFTVQGYPYSGNLAGYYYFSANYLTDPACPAALNGGTPWYVVVAFNASGDSVPAGTYVGGTELPSPEIYTCTRATNPIVENCSQPAIWETDINATLHLNNATDQVSLLGQYQDQVWTWNTENGTITDCSQDGYSPSDFALTPVAGAGSNSSSTSVTPIPSSTASQGQSSGSGNSPPGQGSAASVSASTTITTSSTSTHSGTSGRLVIEILAVGSVAAVLGAGVLLSRGYLRRKL